MRRRNKGDLGPRGDGIVSKISVGLTVELAPGVRADRVDLTEEQLQVAYRACRKAYLQMGELADMVEVIRVYFYQNSGASLPSHMSICFEVIVAVDHTTHQKSAVRSKFGWEDGLSTAQGLANLLVVEVGQQLLNYIEDSETRLRILSAKLRQMNPAAP